MCTPPSSKPVDLRNRQVQFRVTDIHIPNPLTVLAELHGNDTLNGRVIEMSHTGTEGQDFAVVEVQGLRPRLVVPVDRIVVNG